MDLLSEGTTTCAHRTGAPARASENRIQQARASAGAEKAALSRAGGAGEESKGRGVGKGLEGPTRHSLTQGVRSGTVRNGKQGSKEAGPFPSHVLGSGLRRGNQSLQGEARFQGK